MLRPLIVAKILQLLKISKDDEILEIGTGSGYLTCCLSFMGKSVDTLDIDPYMLKEAKKSHSQYNICNINYINEDIFSNWSPEKNYDVIILTGSIDSRIEKLENSLGNNGRMFAVIGSYPVMNVNIIERVSKSKLLCDQSFETILDPLNNINKKGYLNF
jgi:protein-L-isoaspartate(D-aspartate) O-methyltransferase